MSESVLSAPVEATSSRQRVGLPATFAVVLAAVLSAWGTFGDHFHASSIREYAIILGVIAVAAALVFGWVVPRGLRKESAGRTAVMLSVLGFLTIAIFWSGLPPVLAVGGIVLGWAGRSAARGSLACRAAIVVGAVAIVADVLVFVQDQAL
ncbi:MAG TPA: hypothetical protein VK926_05585 [Gaiellaceae bacterium]|nr:hypothetical protein [Gaiellaceae bacterium]